MVAGVVTSGESLLTSALPFAMGRLQPVVTVCEYSASATCYAGLNGRVWPESAVQA